MYLKSYWFNSTSCLLCASYWWFMYFNYFADFQDLYFLITCCHILSNQNTENSFGFEQM